MSSLIDYSTEISRSINQVSVLQNTHTKLGNIISKTRSKGVAAFSSMTNSMRLLGNESEETTTSIDGLEKELKALRSKRNSLVDVKEIKQANTQIAELRERINGLKNPGPSISERLGITNLPLQGFTLLKDGLTEVIKEGSKFEKSMSTLKGLTQGGAGDFEKMKAAAMNMGSTSVFSADQAAQGMQHLAKAGFKSNEIVEAMPDLSNLASASNVDLSTAANMATDILSSYGMKANQLGSVNDKLTQTFISTKTNIETLSAGFKALGPVAQGTGQDFGEMSAMLGLLGGGEAAGKQVATAIQSLQKPSDDAKLALHELGIKTTGSGGKLLSMGKILKQLEAKGADSTQMMKIFGTEAGPALDSILGQGTKALDDLTNKVNGTKGATKELADTNTNNLASDFQKLQNAVTNLSLKVYELLQPALRAIVSIGSSLIQKFSTIYDWVTRNKELFEAFAIGLGVAGIAVALMNAKLIALTIGTKLVTVATSIFNAVLAINPIFLTVAAIAALVAGIVLAYKKFEKFRGIVHGVWEVIKALTLGVWSFIKAVIKFAKGDKLGAAADMAKSMSSFSNIGQSWDKGYEKGVNSGKEKTKDTKKTSPIGESLGVPPALTKMIKPQGTMKDVQVPLALKKSDTTPPKSTMKNVQIPFALKAPDVTPPKNNISPKVVNSVEGLSIEIKRLTALRDKTTNEKQIKAYNKQIKQREKQLNLLKGTDSDKKIKQTTTGINGGGSKQTNINIQLDKLIEDLNIVHSSFDECADDMERKVKEALLRVLNSANQIATQ